MSEKKQTYLEKQLEATLNIEKEQITLLIQKEKVKLDDAYEINMLNEQNPFIHKEITLSEDEIQFTFQIEPSQLTFSKLLKYDERSRWSFASQLLKKVMTHSSTRLHLIVCPENLLIDEGFTPYFLHFGVKESIPPYERNEERIFLETKATIAAAVEPKYSFDQYIQFSSSLELTPIGKKVMEAKDEEELLDILKQQIKAIEKKDRSFTKITKKKWNWFKYSVAGLVVALVPLAIYTGYSQLITDPRQDAFVEVQEPFIQGNYSEIINTLAQYKVEDMPNVIQYELSMAYIVNETLTDEQRENILKTITLQTDPRYFQYWIFIGRGQAEEALSLARQLEDLNLIILALLHYEESVKADHDLKDEEREELLDKIELEKDEYTKQLEELKKTLEAAKAEEEAETSDEAKTPEKEPVKAEEKEPTVEDVVEKEQPAEKEKPAEQSGE